MSEFVHIPVLLNECLENLNIVPEGIYVDGTLGGAGHSSEILKRLGKDGTLVGIDRDEDAIKVATERLAGIDSPARRFIVHENYVNMKNVCNDLEIESVDGILLDLGVSSFQFDTPERGFSYRFDGPLDMRMNQNDTLTAAEIVNTYSERALSDVIYNYGDERWAKRIAQFIVEARKNKPIETTFELVEIIKHAIPKGARQDGGHPAKRTFQSLRVETNGELNVLSDFIEDGISLLKPGGRLCIISFQSLEEGIIKKLFKKAENPCTCPPDFPICVCGKKPLGKMITRSGITATQEELLNNPRSHSAKLRVFEKY